MENTIAKGSQQIYKKFAFLQFVTELFDRNTYEVSELLLLYFDARIQEPWSKDELIVLKPLFKATQNIMATCKIHKRLIEGLKYKSALIFMANDFADLADTLLYSSLMEDIDAMIDTGTYLINSLDEIYAVREISYRPLLRDHTWWCLMDDAITFNGELIREFQRALKFVVDHHALDNNIKRKCAQVTADIIWEKRKLPKKEETQQLEEEILKIEIQRDLLLSTIEPARIARIEFAKTAKALDAANAKVRLLGSVAEPERREALKMFKQADWTRIQAEEAIIERHGFKTVTEMTTNFMMVQK